MDSSRDQSCLAITYRLFAASMASYDFSVVGKATMCGSGSAQSFVMASQRTEFRGERRSKWAESTLLIVRSVTPGAFNSKSVVDGREWQDLGNATGEKRVQVRKRSKQEADRSRLGYLSNRDIDGDRQWRGRSQWLGSAVGGRRGVECGWGRKGAKR